jgi:hypothetical protein
MNLNTANFDISNVIKNVLSINLIQFIAVYNICKNENIVALYVRIQQHETDTPKRLLK